MPPRIAVPLTKELVEQICNVADGDPAVFGDCTHAIIEFLNPPEINMNIKFVNEETMLEAFKNDSTLQILQIGS